MKEGHSFNYVISNEQKKHFGKELEYLSCKGKVTREDIPSLIFQLNLFLDEEGIIRVKSKFGRFQNKRYTPILLPKKGWVTTKIIEHNHKLMLHAGIYTVLNQLRKEFFIPSIYSMVKKVLRQCITCRRFNNRPIRNNQSAY